MYSVRSVQPSAVGRAGAGSGPASPRRQCQLRRRRYGAAVGFDQPVRERTGGARQDPRGGDGMPPAQAPDTVRPGHGPVRRGVFGVFDRAVPGAMPPNAEDRAGPGTAADGRARRGPRTHPDSSAVMVGGRPRDGDRTAASVAGTRRVRRGRRRRCVVHRRDAEADARVVTTGRRCGECRAPGHRVTCGDRGRRGLRWQRPPGGAGPVGGRARTAGTAQRPDPPGRADRSGTAEVDDGHRRASTSRRAPTAVRTPRRKVRRSGFETFRHSFENFSIAPTR